MGSFQDFDDIDRTEPPSCRIVKAARVGETSSAESIGGPKASEGERNHRDEKQEVNGPSPRVTRDHGDQP